jgi:enamine deaminase RidA (YjgF/YER057c/UK114 family)
MSVPPEVRLAELGLQLPAAPPRLGQFEAVAITGSLAFVSGHIPFNEGQVMRGTLGVDLDVASGQEAARAATLGCLSSLRDALGSLDRVARVVKVGAFVRATPEFTEAAHGCQRLLGASSRDLWTNRQTRAVGHRRRVSSAWCSRRSRDDRRDWPSLRTSHHELTGLPNRALFIEHIRRALATLPRRCSAHTASLSALRVRLDGNARLTCRSASSI